MAEPTRSTVTLLFTDIEGSTRLIQQLGEQYPFVLEEHRRLLRTAFREWGGTEVGTQGDSFFVAFARGVDAVGAAVAGQRALSEHRWPAGAAVRVRMGLHTGEPSRIGGGYEGLDVHRAARLCAAGHGGQVLLSQTTRDLVALEPPEGVTLRDLGEHRLKDLPRAERVYQLSAPGLASEFPPLRSLGTRPGHLPPRRTALLGRDRDVAAARDLLLSDDVGLVTLTGPGGIGKTRLAIQVAAAALEEFADGAFFVDLAPIGDPGLVVSTIVQTLGVREIAGSALSETLAEYLRGKRPLLLLDNFEHVLPVAPDCAGLLARCPGLKLLVTSRAALHVYGEREYPVAPLARPDARHLPGPADLRQYPAVALFEQRARDVRPDFRIAHDNAAAVAEICIRLDGLPLAIELAAARVKLLSPRALLTRLAAAPGQRAGWVTGRSPLHLLTGGARDLPARQQTLRGTITWSYDLLDEPEQTIFRRLAVFVGGFTLEAAEAVCAGDESGETRDESGTRGPLSSLRSPLSTLDGLASLVDKSLVRREEAADGEPRFAMLETIREFGIERLEASGEAEAVRRQYAEQYLRLAEEIVPQEPSVSVGLADAVVVRLEEEHGNLRAALDWSAERDAVICLRLVGALWRFWHHRGYVSEGRKRAADVLARTRTRAMDGTRAAARAKVLLAASTLALYQSDYDGAHPLLEESLVVSRQLGEGQGIAESLHGLATVAHHRGELGRAVQLLEESLAMGQVLGDAMLLADALMHRGLMAHRQGDYAEARTFLEQGLAARRRSGSTQGLGPWLSALGYLALDQGDRATARACFEERLAHWREVGVARNIALALCSLGELALSEGDPLAARAMFAEGLAVWVTKDDRGGFAFIIGCFASLAAYEGQQERAMRLAGAAAAQRTAFGQATAPSLHLRLDRLLEQVRGVVGGPAGAQAWAEGEAMSFEQAIAYALEDPAPLTPRPSDQSAARLAGLTQREQEIAGLVARGLTSPAIAESLVISPRTADTHIDNIRTKLGLQSRAQLAAWAVEHGLLRT